MGSVTTRAQAAPPAAAGAVRRELSAAGQAAAGQVSAKQRIATQDLAEKRVSAPASMLQQSEAAVAKANVALEAVPSGSDAAARLLAGCYALDRLPERAAFAGTDSAALLLPARVELLSASATASESGTRLLRPVPGDPPFPPGTLASWKVVGPGEVELRIGDAARWFSAVVSIAPDSGGPLTPVMRGRRVACPTP
jgi:hypothetical protein